MNISHNLFRVSSIIAIAWLTTAGQPVQAEESVHEIGWSSRISSMGLDQVDNIGEKYTFYCQPAEEDLIHSPVWGTTEYTVNSGICSTAVHSGLITPETGGEVTIKLIEGKSFYTGSKKNNIISKDHRNTDLAFIFIEDINSYYQTEPLRENSNQKREYSGIERMLMDSFQRGVERTIDKTIENILN